MEREITRKEGRDMWKGDALSITNGGDTQQRAESDNRRMRVCNEGIVEV
jgi:hypothetical protein